MATQMAVYCFRCKRETTLIVSVKNPTELTESELESFGVACKGCQKLITDTGELYPVSMPVDIWP